MIRAARIPLLPLFLCLASVLPAAGSKDKGALVKISGTVQMIGSGPLPEMVITGADLLWFVDKEDIPKLKDLQHRVITVEGYETVAAMVFANGSPAGERRTIKEIRIISVL